MEDAQLFAIAGLETNTSRKNPAAVVNENHAASILLALSARENEGNTQQHGKAEHDK